MKFPCAREPYGAVRTKVPCTEHVRTPAIFTPQSAGSKCTMHSIMCTHDESVEDGGERGGKEGREEGREEGRVQGFAQRWA